MLLQIIQEAYKYVDSMPNLSRFDFNDVTNCLTYIKVNLRTNSPTKQSLSEMATCLYQGLFIDFCFSGWLSYNKEGKVIPSSCKDIEGINEETD